MSAPAFVPPIDPTEKSQEQPAQEQGPFLSPPLIAMMATIEAVRASVNGQLDALAAQVNSLAYTGAAINNARRARVPAASSSEMPATFGARPSAPPTRPVEELTNAIES